MEHSRLKNWVIRHGQEPWGQWPYHLGAQVVSCYFRLKTGAACWPRHSYVFADIVPGISDLDFTLFFSVAPKKRSVASALKHARGFKKGILPILGELNIYEANDAVRFIPLANPFELRRDPVLIEKMGYAPSFGSASEKLVFLLRSLDADKKNLTSAAAPLREKKWRRAFLLAGLSEINEFGFEKLVRSVCALMPEWNDLPEELLAYLRTGHTDSENVKMLFANYFLHDVENAIHQNHPLKDIVYAQLKWEAWGLLGQVYQLAARPAHEVEWWAHHNETCLKIDKKMEWGLAEYFTRLHEIFISK